jgi:hypothetical protein
MFDDLDPDFLSSPGPALPIVAARVYAIRKRRWIVVSSAVGAIAVFILGSMAFGGGGKNPDRLTVSRRVTTTTEASSNILKPLVTVSTSSTSTTVAATSTTATVPIATTTTSPKTTTTAPKPAHLTVAFDRNHLVIQSGKSVKIPLTITNDGGKSAPFGYQADCEPYFVWPADQSTTHPIAWPAASGAGGCPMLRAVEVGAHKAVRISVTVEAGLLARLNNQINFVPAPPGDGSILVRNSQGSGQARLPVTITPPDTLPLTIDHPSEVTTASGAQHFVDFTITNNLPFAVTFVEQGPCSEDVGTPCVATTSDGSATGDLRNPPYATAVRPLYLTTFTLQAHETRIAHAAVHGTTNLGAPGPDNSLPPGVYSFDWDGEKVTFTVT